MIEKVAIFILFLGPLVFFHELGHYFFARLFGVRVEVFSLGFGPKILKFIKGDTEYAVSAIPLGGYVKMYGDDPLNKDAVPEDQRKFSFTHKGKWARFWIVMGGPLANFILAWVIFFSLFMSGERLPEIKMGVINNDSPLHQMGFMSGDVIKKVNGKTIYNPSDIAMEGEGVVKTVTVERQNSMVQNTVNLPGEKFFEILMDHPPLLRKPVVVDQKGQLYAVSFDPKMVDWKHSLDVMATFQKSNVLYIFPLTEDFGEEADPAYDVSKAQKIEISFTSREEFISKLADLGYRTMDLLVKDVNAKSPAFFAGMKKGDVILTLDGKIVYSFEQLRKNLQDIPKPEVPIDIWSEGKIKTVKVVPDIQEQDGKKVKLIGVYSAGRFIGLDFVNTESRGLIGSFTAAFSRTWDTMAKTVDGFFKLITAKVSFKTIGGPLAIGKVASDSFNTSISYFFQLMALISVNLGVINLFPIPVLDGGHIMFIFLEILNRGPVSRRKMEIAQQLGLSILLMLMVGAIFNDFSRFF
ncbi:MAG: RIP metalloprotease RseP [Deltaproteobacteria bacterium]|nr:MAG: RIP metalloprotease RseP [Deltaproteobacteria bacterium]